MNPKKKKRTEWIGIHFQGNTCWVEKAIENVTPKEIYDAMERNDTLLLVFNKKEWERLIEVVKTTTPEQGMVEVTDCVPCTIGGDDDNE